MSYTNTIFNQLLTFLPKYHFNAFVGQHNSDKYTKKLTAWNQFIALLYAQATGKESLRDIQTGLSLHEEKWAHLGVKSVARSTLSYANNKRDYRVFEELFYEILKQCKDIIPSKSFTFDNPLYSLDSTTIKLCLSMFDWAKYTKTKGALKMHTLLNNKTMLPSIIISSDGKKGDITGAKEMGLEDLENDSIVVFDRGYIDYSWWKKLNDNKIFFVSRTKINQNIFVAGKHNTELQENILADEKVYVGESEKYPEPLRRIRFYDQVGKKEYIFITNNFELTACEIALIYKQRWQIELFFKWIKQNLKIKTFIGTSENAVLSQIWIAMIYYLLLSYIKFQTKFEKSLLELTRMIRETLFVRRNLIDMLSLDSISIERFKAPPNPQMGLF